MAKIRRPLAEADRIVTTLIGDLAPACYRIAVAGSVRRRKEMVGDLELVAIPRYDAAGLFGDCRVNALWSYLQTADRYRFMKGNHAEGRYYQLSLPEYGHLQVDLFLATPENWGITYLVRTGSAAFSSWILGRWKWMQGIGREQPGSVGGRLVTRTGSVVPTPEEEDVFALLGMEPVPPEQRDGAWLTRSSPTAPDSIMSVIPR